MIAPFRDRLIYIFRVDSAHLTCDRVNNRTDTIWPKIFVLNRTELVIVFLFQSKAHTFNIVVASENHRVGLTDKPLRGVPPPKENRGGGAANAPFSTLHHR